MKKYIFFNIKNTENMKNEFENETNGMWDKILFVIKILIV